MYELRESHIGFNTKCLVYKAKQTADSSRLVYEDTPFCVLWCKYAGEFQSNDVQIGSSFIGSTTTVALRTWDNTADIKQEMNRYGGMVRFKVVMDGQSYIITSINTSFGRKNEFDRFPPVMSTIFMRGAA